MLWWFMNQQTKFKLILCYWSIDREKIFSTDISGGPKNDPHFFEKHNFESLQIIFIELHMTFLQHVVNQYVNFQW